MLPRKFAPVLFGLILSGLMSLLVSGISTYRAVGFGERYAGLWAGAWVTAWLVAFPVVLVLAPLVHRLVARMVNRGQTTVSTDLLSEQVTRRR